MTVKDLISALEAMPQNADVYIPSQTGGWNTPSFIETEGSNEYVVRIS